MCMPNPYSFILRNDKGSALTHNELDNNFRYIDWNVTDIITGTTNLFTIDGSNITNVDKTKGFAVNITGATNSLFSFNNISAIFTRTTSSNDNHFGWVGNFYSAKVENLNTNQYAFHEIAETNHDIKYHHLTNHESIIALNQTGEFSLSHSSVTGNYISEINLGTASARLPNDYDVSGSGIKMFTSELPTGGEPFSLYYQKPDGITLAVSATSAMISQHIVNDVSNILSFSSTTNNFLTEISIGDVSDGLSPYDNEVKGIKVGVFSGGTGLISAYSIEESQIINAIIAAQQHVTILQEDSFIVILGDVTSFNIEPYKVNFPYSLIFSGIQALSTTGFTMGYTRSVYVYNGSSDTTWVLPENVENGLTIFIKNKSNNILTLSGISIYHRTSSTTLPLAGGDSVILIWDGGNWLTYNNSPAQAEQPPVTTTQGIADTLTALNLLESSTIQDRVLFAGTDGGFFIASAGTETSLLSGITFSAIKGSTILPANIFSAGNNLAGLRISLMGNVAVTGTTTFMIRINFGSASGSTIVGWTTAMGYMSNTYGVFRLYFEGMNWFAGRIEGGGYFEQYGNMFVGSGTTVGIEASSSAVFYDNLPLQMDITVEPTSDIMSFLIKSVIIEYIGDI